MKYLLKTDAEFAVNRDDTKMFLYSETVDVKHGYALTSNEDSKNALLPRSFSVVEELADDDTRTLDELIAEQNEKTETE